MPNALKSMKKNRKRNVRSGYVFNQMSKVEQKLITMFTSLKGAKSNNAQDMVLVRDNALRVYNILCECIGDDE